MKLKLPPASRLLVPYTILCSAIICTCLWIVTTPGITWLEIWKFLGLMVLIGTVLAISVSIWIALWDAARRGQDG